AGHRAAPILRTEQLERSLRMTEATSSEAERALAHPRNKKGRHACTCRPTSGFGTFGLRYGFLVASACDGATAKFRRTAVSAVDPIVIDQMKPTELFDSGEVIRLNESVQHRPSCYASAWSLIFLERCGPKRWNLRRQQTKNLRGQPFAVPSAHGRPVGGVA